MIDDDTAEALRQLAPRPNRPHLTFHAELAVLAAMLAPTGRDGLWNKYRYGVTGPRSQFMPMRLSSRIYGPPPIPWEQELSRIRRFTGMECTP